MDEMIANTSYYNKNVKEKQVYTGICLIRLDSMVAGLKPIKRLVPVKSVSLSQKA